MNDADSVYVNRAGRITLRCSDCFERRCADDECSVCGAVQKLEASDSERLEACLIAGGLVDAKARLAGLSVDNPSAYIENIRAECDEGKVCCSFDLRENIKLGAHQDKNKK